MDEVEKKEKLSRLLLEPSDYEFFSGRSFEEDYDPSKKRKFSHLINKSKKKQKETISDGIKWTVWERDNFTCQHCGSRKNLSVDHIFPESKGGTLELSNLQTLCRHCNSKKGAKI